LFATAVKNSVHRFKDVSGYLVLLSSRGPWSMSLYTSYSLSTHGYV